MTPPTAGFPTLLQQFFQRRLLAERGASAHTIASYRDTFELLLRYAERQTGRTASALTLADLDAPLVSPSSTTSSTSAATRRARATSA